MVLLIQIHHGDLLAADVDAYVNTVNTVGVMGKGLALQFRRAFPENARKYSAAARRGELELGRMYVTNEVVDGRRRLIINFPTKKHWRSKSRIEDIESGLRDLHDVLAKSTVQSVAVPPLGCGLGGLEWGRVRPRIEAALADLPMEVRIYEPGAPPNAEAMAARNRSPRPRLTHSRAALVGALARYGAISDEEASPLVAQKLLYFLQSAGEPLQLSFTQQPYGPYADATRHILVELEGHMILGGSDGTGREPLRLIAGADAEAEAVLTEDADARARYDRVIQLLTGYESPYSIELLATVHWVAVHDGASDPDEALERVKEWSDRKARIFRPAHVRTAWNRLSELGWLPTGQAEATV